MPRRGRMSFIEAAAQILSDAGGALHANEICDRACRQGLIEPRGDTPRASMAAALAVHVSRRGQQSRFRRTAPNTFCLAGQAESSGGERQARPRRTRTRRNTSLWPLPGGAERYADTLRAMLRHIQEETGAGRAIDFDGLADWLATRYELRGESAPRTYAWLTVQIGVAEQTGSGGLALTAEGRQFTESGDGRILGRLLADRIAGVADVFSSLYPKRTLDSGVFQSRWEEEYGWTRTWQTYYRLNWLRSAGLARKTDSGEYGLTARGRELAEELGLTEAPVSPEPDTREQLSLHALMAENRAAVRAELRGRLMQMSPAQFEHFAAELLEALGFSEIDVTGRSSDGGIDGHGTMRVGIVTVNAAFQCKRWTAAVGRPELQRFRGAITGRFDQGVYVTTSSFSRPAQQDSIQRGAIPIILLDGDGIADEMIRHGVGVNRRPLELLAVDEDFFAARDETA